MSKPESISVAEFKRQYLDKQPPATKRARISPLCFGTVPLAGVRRAEATVLTLPLPPTKNAEPTNKFERQRVRDHWSTLSATAWNMAGGPRFDRVRVTPFFFLKRLNRDRDNCLGDAWKGLQDGLRGRLVSDDDGERFDLQGVQFGIAEALPYLMLFIEELAPAGAEEER